MEFDWHRYAAERTRETTLLAQQILQSRHVQRLGKAETDALLHQLRRGAEGLRELTAVLALEHADDAAVRLVRSLEVTWARLTNVVETYAALAEAGTCPLHLRLVASN